VVERATEIRSGRGREWAERRCAMADGRAHQSKGSLALRWAKRNVDKLKTERSSPLTLPRAKKIMGGDGFGLRW
jgi:hypothetical protein